jgi:hypothetical protein
VYESLALLSAVPLAVILPCVLHGGKWLTKPLRIYTNALIDRILISREYRGRTIIYQWYNNVTGETYIGSAICGGTRLSRYFFNSVLSAGLKVYLNILLHGHGSFSVAILEDLGPTGSVSVETMLAREQYYITILFRDFPN